MSHTLILENVLATKWSRYPWSTQLGSLEVQAYPRHVCPYMGMGFHPGVCIDKALLKHFSLRHNYLFAFDPFCNISEMLQKWYIFTLFATRFNAFKS